MLSFYYDESDVECGQLRELAYFTSQELVRKAYRELHGGSISASKARSIALHVEQGISFFESSRGVPVSIRPLTQYYGVAALTRAVALFNSQTLVETTLTQGHGLSVINWHVLHAEKEDRGFGELRLRVTNGLLRDMVRATSGRTSFRANSSKPNWFLHFGEDELATGTEFRFDNIVGLLPDLWREYEAWSGRLPVGFNVVSVNTETDSCTWTLESKGGRGDVGLVFQDQSVDVLESDAPKRVRVRTSVSPHIQPVQLFRGAFDIGDTLLVPPISESAALSPLALLYCNSYVLSMLARYRLSNWLALWRGEKGDAARPLFEQVMNLVEAEYPVLCAYALQPEVGSANNTKPTN